MPKYFKISLVFALLLSLTAGSNMKYVTVKMIKASLPHKPIVAGFDIDDTVLFSSPGFFYGENNKDGKDSTNIYGTSPLESLSFWTDMNGKFDKFSLPKKSGSDLVTMHYTRGDKVVFITARDSTTTSILPQILMMRFNISKPKVIYTCNAPKAPSIYKAHVTVYYGDADSDMQQAVIAKARPIRVMRSKLSTNKTSPYNPGKFGEEIVIHSEN